MSRKPTSTRTRPKRKTVLRLPDLDQAKSAVLNSLTSAMPNVDTDTQLMNSWNGTAQNLGSLSTGLLCSLSIHLEGRRLAPGTVNLRLGAVQRLAYEAADCRLLSPDLAAASDE